MIQAPIATQTKPPLRFRPVDAVGLPLAFAVAASATAAGVQPVVAAVLTCFALAAPALARYDFTERRLPNAITVPLIVLGLIAAVANAVTGDFSVFAAFAVGAALFAMAIAGGMGMGDVKLGLALALAAAGLGWEPAVAGFVAAVLLGGLVAVAALLLRKHSLAFGPWLLVGYAIAAAIWVSART